MAVEPAGPAGRPGDIAAKGMLHQAGIKFQSFNSFLLQDIKAVHVDFCFFNCGKLSKIFVFLFFVPLGRILLLTPVLFVES